ncbi:MAG: trypsin-like peptidase domain-containing protein [bacterium]|nr:trypsin-like peptidase domain-containing protein [bacterium]
MNKRNTSPGGVRRGLNMVGVGLIAVASILAGMLISSELDFSAKIEADTPTNVSQTGLFPVVQTDDDRLESPFVRVVEQVQNAVVNISARTKREELPWWHQGPNFSTSSGSGFFFREDGYVLTNNHVIEGADELMVRTSTGYEYEATLVGRDQGTDLAVLKVSPEEEITAIPFGDSKDIRVGDWAIAIGNPFPQQGLDRTVTVGVISAKGRSNLRFGRETPRYQNYIQTDASINPGNSGGPLLNLRGECIGINAAISSPTGSSVGIGFAIPVSLARAVVPDLIATGHVSRGWLGVWLNDVTEREAKRQGLEAVRGVLVDSVFSNSPAEKAGIMDGDIIIGFNDQEVENGDELRVLVSTVKSGSSVAMKVVRDGKYMNMVAQVGDRDDADALVRGGNDGVERTSWMGMSVERFSQQKADEIGAEYLEGMYVDQVQSGSPAARASIAPGTIILQVNNKVVSSIDQFNSVTGSIQNQKMRIPLIVLEPDGSIARKVIRQDRN